MKKHFLLVLVTVFVIGIQSCSTEETGIEGENNLSKSLRPINTGEDDIMDRLDFCQLYVLYPPGTTEEERIEYRSSKIGLGKTFTFIQGVQPSNCDARLEIWKIPCDEIPTVYCDHECRNVSSFTGSTLILESGSGNTDNNGNDEEDGSCTECPERYRTVNSNPSCFDIFRAIGWG